MRVALAPAFFYVASSREEQSVTPVEKVIKLIKDLEDSVAEEGSNEAQEYDKFACFCKHQDKSKNEAIEKSEEKIEVLEADIEDYDAEITQLDEDITELGERIDEIKEDVIAKDKTRMDEHKVYLEEEADLSSAISAIKRAMAALQNSKKDLKGDVDLYLLQHVEPMASKILNVMTRSRHAKASDAQLEAIMFLAEHGKPGKKGKKGDKGPATGKSHDYEYRSNDIIQTLQDLLKTFNENLKECDEEEFTASSEHAKERLDLTNERKFKEKEKEEKETRVEELSEMLHEAEKNKDEETEAKESDEAFLDELHTQCEKKAENWDERSKARAKEMAALREAVTILEGTVKASYKGNKKLNLADVKKGVSFLQLRSSEDQRKAAIRNVIDFLSSQGKSLKSATLAGIATQVFAGADHFAKIRGLIKDMIEKLKDQAADEADQKAFCDKEMGESLDKRDENSLKMEEEGATIASKRTEKEELERDNAELKREIAELHLGIKEAKELRDAEKAGNEKTIQLAKSGHEAVEFAIETLSTFYTGASLAQKKKVDSKGPKDRHGDVVPSGEGESYEGNQDAAKGIIGLMEVILADFERTKEKTEKAEEDAVKAFEDFEKDSKASIKDKEQEVENNESDIASAVDAITEAMDQRNEAMELKKAAEKELMKLKPMCVDPPDTYAQRVKKRQDEIQALKDAMRMLDEM